MSDSVIKQLPKLKALAEAKPKERKKLLERTNLVLIKSIVECIDNVLRGNVRLTSAYKDKLRKYKNILRKINTTGTKLRHKKQVIVQNGGGFLPLLLAPVISVVAEHLIRKLR